MLKTVRSMYETFYLHNIYLDLDVKFKNVLKYRMFYLK